MQWTKQGILTIIICLIYIEFIWHVYKVTTLSLSIHQHNSNLSFALTLLLPNSSHPTLYHIHPIKTHFPTASSDNSCASSLWFVMDSSTHQTHPPQPVACESYPHSCVVVCGFWRTSFKLEAIISCPTNY